MFAHCIDAYESEFRYFTDFMTINVQLEYFMLGFRKQGHARCKGIEQLGDIRRQTPRCNRLTLLPGFYKSNQSIYFGNPGRGGVYGYVGLYCRKALGNGAREAAGQRGGAYQHGEQKGKRASNPYDLLAGSIGGIAFFRQQYCRCPLPPIPACERNGFVKADVLVRSFGIGVVILPFLNAQHIRDIQIGSFRSSGHALIQQKLPVLKRCKHAYDRAELAFYSRVTKPEIQRAELHATQACHISVAVQHGDTEKDDIFPRVQKMEPARPCISIRKAADRKTLWQAIRRGEVQTVSTDHCSFTTAQKLAGKDDFTAIPGGLPGVETRGELIYTFGVTTRKISLAAMCRVLAENPARLYGMFPRKGIIAEGADADIVVYDPQADHVIRAEDMVGAADYNPYEGVVTRGSIRQVWLRGKLAVNEGRVLAGPDGKYIRRGKCSL